MPKNNLPNYRLRDFKTPTGREYFEIYKNDLHKNLIKKLEQEDINKVIEISTIFASTAVETQKNIAIDERKPLRLKNGKLLDVCDIEKVKDSFAYHEILNTIRSYEGFFKNHGTAPETIINRLEQNDQIDSIFRMQIQTNFEMVSMIRAEIKYPEIAAPENEEARFHTRGIIRAFLQNAPILTEYIDENPAIPSTNINNVLNEFWPKVDSAIENNVLPEIASNNNKPTLH